MSDFETWSQTTEEGRWICDGESATQLRVYKDIFDHAYEAGRKAGVDEAAETAEIMAQRVQESADMFVAGTYKLPDYAERNTYRRAATAIRERIK